jgi:hypothetical protein
MPLEQMPGKVYVLHYDVQHRVKSVGRDYARPNVVLGPGGLMSAKPIRHYVGWSQQADPRKRIYNHGPAALREIVHLAPGTMVDELGLKVVGKCPKCGERYAEDLVPQARRTGEVRSEKVSAGEVRAAEVRAGEVRRGQVNCASVVPLIAASDDRQRCLYIRPCPGRGGCTIFALCEIHFHVLDCAPGAVRRSSGYATPGLTASIGLASSIAC